MFIGNKEFIKTFFMAGFDDQHGFLHKHRKDFSPEDYIDGFERAAQEYVAVMRSALEYHRAGKKIGTH